MKTARFLIIVCVMTMASHAFAQTVYHVDDDASGGDGLTWQTAFTSIQDALAVVQNGDEIWVATGVYHPATFDAPFIIPECVQLLGGFNGTESAADQAQPHINETTLSGDLLNNDGPDFTNRDDNAVHVVRCTNVSFATVIDGFTIESGHADNGNDDSRGGGMINDGASPTIRRCTFRDNHAVLDGAGLYNVNNSSPSVSDCLFTENLAEFGAAIYNREGSAASINRCKFINNEATNCGGAIYNNDSNANYTNCLFVNNSAMFFQLTSRHGGAIYSNGSAFDLVNCTIVDNMAGGRGGGIYATSSSDVLIENSILWGNTGNDGDQGHVRFNSTLGVSYSTVEGGQSGISVNATLNWSNNLDTDPNLNAELMLSSGSTAINAGNPRDLFACNDKDLEGHARILCDRIDMGAYEFGIGDWDCNQIVDVLDWSEWEDCLKYPENPGCEAYHFVGDCEFNLLSYGGFQRVYAP